MDNREPITDQDSPGSLLRAAREEKGLSQREAADRLNWLPSYIGIIENNDYAALRSPALARGYIRAYGRLLGLGEAQLMSAFDSASVDAVSPVPVPVRRAPLAVLPAQKAGLAIVLCLATLVLLVFALWWWGAGVDEPVEPAAAVLNQQPSTTEDDL